MKCRLLPLVATTEMLEAARHALDGQNLSKMTRIGRARYKHEKRWLAMVAAAPVMTDWISVDERLPDDDVSVMVALQGEHGEPVWIGFHDEAGWHSATDAVPLGDMVTHWKNIEEGPTCS